jgi:hypothetical protein
MTARGWNSEIAKNEIARLIAPGVLGFYTHFEATVVFAFPPDQLQPVNVFTIPDRIILLRVSLLTTSTGQTLVFPLHCSMAIKRNQNNFCAQWEAKLRVVHTQM